MNNEQKQYILRKPVTILHELDYSLELNLGEYMMPVDKDCFKDEFVPLDVSGLTRQVEESLTFLCQYAYDAGYTIGNDRTVTGKDVDLSVKATALEIVGLLLNQEREIK
jgi:hypothetical protein